MCIYIVFFRILQVNVVSSPFILESQASKTSEGEFCRLLSEAASRVESLVRSRKSHQEAWNASTVVLTWAAKVVKFLVIVKMF